MEIDHIGIACENINLAKKQYTDLGFVVSKELITDFSRNLDYIFMKNGSLTIELIAKHETNLKSDIDNIISQKKLIGNKMYHICYVSQNLEKDINEFIKRGYKLIKPPSIAIACDNNIVAFLFHFDHGVVELIDKKS